jgi:membrane glycosyltransferase
MASEGWRARVRRRRTARSGDSWRLGWTAVVRRALLGGLVLAQTGVFAYGLVTRVLPYHGQQPLELAILSLSVVLFAWVSLGFWTAITGFVLL